MSVVSNASPLVNLGRIGQLGLLPQLYGELLIPEAVWHEVVIQGKGQPGAHEIETANWVRVAPVDNRALVRALRQELDAGEAGAIALAIEHRFHRSHRQRIRVYLCEHLYLNRRCKCLWFHSD